MYLMATNRIEFTNACPQARLFFESSFYGFGLDMTLRRATLWRMLSFTRRTFIAESAGALGALLLTPRTFSAPPARTFPIITFTKPFQSLSFEETAELVAEVGYDGV